MTEPPATTRQRILVAIDASPPGAVALEIASTLAAELRAELQGLFVEDINLLRLAGLPFAREVAHASGTTRSMNVTAMERALRGEAEGVRRAFSDVAQRASLKWSFQMRLLS